MLLLTVGLLHGVGAASALWLVPGPIPVGAGMGLVLTPIATAVLAHVDPQRTGALAGALPTMQQVGNWVGVAVTWVIFFGAVHVGYSWAFRLSMAQLGCLLLAVAVLSRLIPPKEARP